jgi:hypothetical protein
LCALFSTSTYSAARCLARRIGSRRHVPGHHRHLCASRILSTPHQFLAATAMARHCFTTFHPHLRYRHHHPIQLRGVDWPPQLLPQTVLEGRLEAGGLPHHPLAIEIDLLLQSESHQVSSRSLKHNVAHGESYNNMFYRRIFALGAHMCFPPLSIHSICYTFPRTYIPFQVLSPR